MCFPGLERLPGDGRDTGARHKPRNGFSPTIGGNYHFAGLAHRLEEPVTSWGTAFSRSIELVKCQEALGLMRRRSTHIRGNPACLAEATTSSLPISASAH